ncbi:hypothetical protein G7046_g3320 [Stylonectria norvegica]|nr:hypothetical protein G7046_g3320 [Stylonectria norvegica]
MQPPSPGHTPTTQPSFGFQDMAEIHGEEPTDLGLKLWDLFAATAKTYPDREAIVSLWQPQTKFPSSSPECLNRPGNQAYLRWSYRDLKSKAERLADSLQQMGCRQNMYLVAVLWNSAEWGLFFWATAKLGMTFVPIDPNALQDARDTILLIQPQVVVVQDAAGATGLDVSWLQLSHPYILVQCSGDGVAGWSMLHQISASSEQPPALNVTAGGEINGTEYQGNDRERVALVVFTSGTTGNPKGCRHTDRNLISQCCDFDPEPDPSTVFRWLVHTPVCHIFAVNNTLRAWRDGGAVVFPSKSFDVDSTLNALVQEQCSIMSATPTLVKALIAHPDFPSRQELNLRLITIGGTMIGPEDVRLCREALGAEHAIQAYGMSEGAPVVSWVRSDPLLVDGYHPGVGKVLPGSAIRICRPGSCEVLRQSEVGELHIGGSSVISSYFNGNTGDTVYSDKFGTWLATGDQAKIDENGIVYILGRYKDLIIRGGENIYPTRIETKLAEIPGLKAQVVGASDHVAGQVPVAIVASLPKGMTKTDVIQLSGALGPRYALDAVHTLEELGLHSFPITAIGKVKKEKLRQAVAKFRDAEEASVYANLRRNETPATPKPLLETLLDLWEQLSGTRPSKDDDVMYLADSITLLRYCDGVLRACGKRLYLQDLIKHGTVVKQANLLMSRDWQQSKLAATSETAMNHGQVVQQLEASSAIRQEDSTIRQTSLSVREPLKSNAIENGEKEARFSLPTAEKTAWNSAEKTIVKEGLRDSYVEEVLPIRDSLLRMVMGQRPQSYHNRLVFRIRSASNQQVRRGLEKGLASRPLLRSIICHSDTGAPSHAIVSTSPALLEQLIRDFEVETEDDAIGLSKNDSAETHSSPFMFQADIIRTREGSQVFLSMTFNHSVIDALTLMPWHRDLDRLIHDENQEVPGLTPYKLFSDLISQYEGSLPATKSISYHVKRLRGISRFAKALWPPQRAPGWMLAGDSGSKHAEERRKVRNTVWKGEWDARAAEFQYPRCCRVVRLPGLAKLKERHSVDPSLFAKCAVVLFNVLQTGASHALFNTWESGRSWPFVPNWMETLLPPAMSIDGPTVQWVLNMPEVISEETIAAFFGRMILEQEQIQQHQHAPWGQIVHGLRDEGDVAIDASFRQSFVWDVSMGFSLSQGLRNDFMCMEPVARYDWADCGLFWNAFMIDSDNLYFIASWDTAQMNDVEVDAHCDRLSEVMRALAQEDNWDKAVGEVFRMFVKLAGLALGLLQEASMTA